MPRASCSPEQGSVLTKPGSTVASTGVTMMRVNREQTVDTAEAIVLYEGEPLTGELEDTDGNGRVVGLTSYQNGIEHGPQTEWYSTGQKHIEGQCDRGAAVGEWREWHPNGQLAEYSLFNKFGELVHLQRWDQEGALVEDKKSGITRGLQGGQQTNADRKVRFVL